MKETNESIAAKIFEKKIQIITESCLKVEIREIMELFDQYDELQHMARKIHMEGK